IFTALPRRPKGSIGPPFRRLRLKNALTAAAGVLAVLLLEQAPAGAKSLVALEIDPCVRVDRAQVRRVVTVELGDAPTDASAAGVDRTRVAVSCIGELVELRVDDPITGKSLERTIDLAEAPRASPRLLALAI